MTVDRVKSFHAARAICIIGGLKQRLQPHTQDEISAFLLKAGGKWLQN